MYAVNIPSILSQQNLQPLAKVTRYWEGRGRFFSSKGQVASPQIYHRLKKKVLVGLFEI